jgi:hypothetical protein
VRVVALVGDLLDRSKIAAAIPDVAFASTPEECAGAGAVIIDVKAHPGVVAAVRKLVPAARVVVYGRHDNPDALDSATSAGADAALPRSRFFHDPAAAITFPP